MRLTEYSDEDLIEEIKHRGLKIEVPERPIYSKKFVLIGGVHFDISK